MKKLMRDIEPGTVFRHGKNLFIRGGHVESLGSMCAECWDIELPSVIYFRCKYEYEVIGRINADGKFEEVK